MQTKLCWNQFHLSTYFNLTWPFHLPALSVNVYFHYQYKPLSHGPFMYSLHCDLSTLPLPLSLLPHCLMLPIQLTTLSNPVHCHSPSLHLFPPHSCPLVPNTLNIGTCPPSISLNPHCLNMPPTPSPSPSLSAHVRLHLSVRTCPPPPLSSNCSLCPLLASPRQRPVLQPLPVLRSQCTHYSQRYIQSCTYCTQQLLLLDKFEISA